METDNPLRKRRFSWLKAALVVSVLLNLAGFAMLGAIATRAGEPGSVLRAAVSALPGETRRDLRRDTRAIWRDARLHGGGMSSQRDIIAALRAEEFDEALFSAALTQAQAHLVQIGTQMHQQLIAQVSTLSPEARQAYADALEDALKQRRWRDRGTGNRRPELPSG
ncbi:MAG: periplasmic heavy metal sensor [Rhodobacteraceae bacterium]|nr:MAG: periplasmic heavy metal sensor [Paracoccaceae bacterium]